MLHSEAVPQSLKPPRLPRPCHAARKKISDLPRVSPAPIVSVSRSCAVHGLEAALGILGKAVSDAIIQKVSCGIIGIAADTIVGIVILLETPSAGLLQIAPGVI